MLALLLCCALAIGAFSSAALAAEETIVKSYDDLSYAIANGGNIKLGQTSRFRAKALRSESRTR